MRNSIIALFAGLDKGSEEAEGHCLHWSQWWLNSSQLTNHCKGRGTSKVCIMHTDTIFSIYLICYVLAFRFATAQRISTLGARWRLGERLLPVHILGRWWRWQQKSWHSWESVIHRYGIVISHRRPIIRYTNGCIHNSIKQTVLTTELILWAIVFVELFFQLSCGL